MINNKNLLTWFVIIRGTFIIHLAMVIAMILFVDRPEPPCKDEDELSLMESIVNVLKGAVSGEP